MQTDYPISAYIIADSITAGGSRLVTYELEYPRWIHAEILTHKMLSKNSQSSRAVPVASVLKANSSPVYPLIYGKNISGMSSVEELKDWRKTAVKLIWGTLSKLSFWGSKGLLKLGLHKQWANRPTEPYSRIKVVISGTEWQNFFWLRNDPEAAQPEIVALAQLMQKLYEESTPELLKPNEWHTPYVPWVRINGKQTFYEQGGAKELTVEEALQISASCCAQVSYRKLDTSKEKALTIFERLFSGAKPHYSPVEHQGCAMQNERATEISQEFGVSHTDRKGFNWSGNLKGFIQYRKVLEYSNEMLNK